MAKAGVNIGAQCHQIITDVKAGVFAPVYLLMGDEPYYPDMVCQAIIDNCIDEFGKDFNETICYGSDVTSDQVINAALRYPMMSDRQLVVLKEAQLMKGLEDLAAYCAEPLDSTVLVILMHKASADKRKAFYKSVQKIGVIVDSPEMRDYEMPNWISGYYSSRGLTIDPDAALLLAESAGTNLSTITVETEKLLKNLPEGTTRVTAQDIEKNVGISKQFSIFELNKEIAARNNAKALRIASHLGNSAKFAMPAAISALYTQFYRILKYGALVAKGNYSQEEKSAALAGVNPYFYREYDMAVRNYPLPKAMTVIALLCEYDYLGKGGDGASSTTPGELLVELTAKILSV